MNQINQTDQKDQINSCSWRNPFVTMALQ